MERYSKYKVSGIEWIGEIPEHWIKSRLAYNGKFLKGRGISKSQLSSDGLPVILYGDLYTRYNLKTNAVVRRFPSNLAEQSVKIKKGDLLFAASGETAEEIGKCICYFGDEDAYASGDVVIYRHEQFDSTFLAYLFNSYKINEQKAKLSKGEIVVHIYPTQLRDIPFYVPETINEQKAIASYLDKKTAEIDKIIKGKEALVQLYEEEKAAIINRAVTKGIDATVKLKPSGVEWLGDIPEHWEVKKCSRCFDLIGSGTTPKSSESKYYFEAENNWLLTGDLNDGIIGETSKKITEEALKDYSTLKIYPSGSIVIAMYGATIGKLGLLNIETSVNQACCVLSSPRFHLNHYIFYYLLAIRQHIINLSYGGGQPNISQETVKGLKVVYPPKKEQTQIVNYIEKETKRINTKINHAQQLIKLLTEYRTTLISEVVTGKIKVID